MLDIYFYAIILVLYLTTNFDHLTKIESLEMGQLHGYFAQTELQVKENLASSTGRQLTELNSFQKQKLLSWLFLCFSQIFIFSNQQCVSNSKQMN